MAEQGGKRKKFERGGQLRTKSKIKANKHAVEAFGELHQYTTCFLLHVENASSFMTTTKAASYLTTYMKIHSRTPIIHQVVGLVSELLIDHHKNIKGSPAAIILAALVARISSSKLGRVERGLSHPRRLSTLSLPERDPHASGKSLYECPHSQHASDAII